jgi:hypothetical protein
MKPCKALLWGLALVAFAAGEPARAAWNNVFEVCCHSCRKQPAVSGYAPSPCCPPAPCCPQQQCTTRYSLRTYYQPVTTYQQSCSYEPVTTYRTSYYYEPVTSYRYSCYYDPCTCSYQQVATPCTSYQLRSRCCPVTSYLQRCCLQPVTTYQQMNYYVPETTCCQTTVGAPIPAPCNTAPSVTTPPITTAPPGGNPPSVSDYQQRSFPPYGSQPNVSDSSTFQQQQGNEAQKPFMPKVDSNSYRPPQLQGPMPLPQGQPTQQQPKVRLERITSLPDANVHGQLVGAGQAPQGGARILFVSEEQQRDHRTATTDGAGNFQLTLGNGNWLVYVPGADGRLVFNQKVQVEGSTPRQVLLVNR